MAHEAAQNEAPYGSKQCPATVESPFVVPPAASQWRFVPPMAIPPSDGDLTMGAFLARDDMASFVERCAGAALTAERFKNLPIPDGITAEQMFELVEFIRHSGMGMLICGQKRACSRGGTWYAMTSEMFSRLSHLEYRVRSRGTLHKQFLACLDTQGFYPPLLEELQCALLLDGVEMPYETLRGLAMGELTPLTPAEKLTVNALSLLHDFNEETDAPPDVTVEHLGEIYHRLIRNVGDLKTTPVPRPPTPYYSICDNFNTQFIADALQGVTPTQEPLIFFALFCSDAIWKKDIFPQFNNTMEIFLRTLLFSVADAPLLHYVPLALPFWRWQCGATEACDGVTYPDAMMVTRFGLDATTLMLCMLNFLERGLDNLAGWVRTQRSELDSCRNALRASYVLNLRQQELLLDLLENPARSFDAGWYGRFFGIAASTAYADLHKLESLGYITASIQGKKASFCAAKDLARRVLAAGARS